MSRKIEVQILGDSKSLEAALGKAQQKTSKFGSALAVGTKVAAGAFVGLGLAAKVGIDEINESQKVLAQTQAVIKSTGGAANVTAGHVNTMAQSLLNVSGVSDETIASGENMLLTFRNIHNEVGRTNDVFDQATKATLDLSVAMGKDMQSSAILVGKALNDPVKGLTALRRVGVSFTADQEALIKKLVATGNTMEAQKLILGELNQEFGGSAKAAGQTLSGQLGVLKEHFSDVAAQVVTALLPSLQSLIGVLTSATSWMKQNQEATKIIVATIAGLATTILVVNAAYKAWGAITAVVTAAQWALNVALSSNPIYAIIELIILLGVALVVAYKKSETFRNIVNGAFNAVKAVAGAVIGFIGDHWKILLALLGGPVGVAIGLVISHFHTLRNAAGAVLGFIGNKVQTVIDVFKSLWGWIEDVISKLESAFSLAQKVASAVSGFAGGGAAPIVHPSAPHPGGPQVANPGVAKRSDSYIIHLQLDGKTFYSAMVSQDKAARRQNGRSLLAT